jgi:hypothetical protein
LNRLRLTYGALFASFVLFCLNASSQQSNMAVSGANASAHGTLTVTLTVVSSVGMVVGPDGEQRIVLANAVDPADNVSRLQPAVKVKLTPVVVTRDNQKRAKNRPKN